MTDRNPAFANWLLTRFIDPVLAEDLLGDLAELHTERLQKMPAWRAIIQYYIDVLSLVSSYAIKKRKADKAFHPYANTQNNIAMLKNYIKVAWRSLGKQKLFTGINILGLSAGMSIGILFITLIAFVKTYDRFHTNKGRIYRVISRTDDKINNKLYASSPTPLANMLKENYPGFGQVVRINKSLKGEAQFANKALPLSGYFVDNNFLEVFSFDLEAGDRSLSDPHKILITSTFAEKMFAHTEAIGQTISLGELGDYIVGGILKDIPKNSHMHFEALLPYDALLLLSKETQLAANLNDWTHFRGNYTYFMVDEKNDISSLDAILATISQATYKDISQFDASFRAQPLAEISLGSDTSDELGTSWGTEIYLISLGFTLLILLPACFNYANLSTARALNRAKEIGMRKVVGGLKKQIFLQFILETIILSLISLIGAYFIFTLIRGEFQSMLVSGLTSLDFSITPINFTYSVIFAILTGFTAGIFPAIHFAGITPVAALKKTAKQQIMGKVNIQKTLLVIQFALSFGFIMGVVVFIDQYRSALNYDLGFVQENLLDIPLYDVEPDILRAELDQMSAVSEVSMSSHLMGINTNDAIWLQNGEDSTIVMQMFIDHNYIDNLGLDLMAGSNFTASPGQQERYVLVNEEFINKFNLQNPAHALDQSVIINDSTELRIGGVVRNFHFQNLSRQIQPFIFRSNPDKYAYAQVKITSPDVLYTLDEMESKWKGLSEFKFEARFFEDEIDEAFNLYSNVVKIFFFLGLLAITISCLGLLGMVVFSTQNRTKEVGIRKVMGATVQHLTLLLTKDYLKLMAIGAVIAIPISYMLFSVMVAQQNAYSTGIGVFPVLISLVILFTLGIVTVMSQTLRAARANPTDTLRYE